jgi:hypothetical protein
MGFYHSYRSTQKQNQSAFRWMLITLIPTHWLCFELFIVLKGWEMGRMDWYLPWKWSYCHRKHSLAVYWTEHFSQWYIEIPMICWNDIFLETDSHLLRDEHPSENAQLQEVNNSLGFILARSNCYVPTIKIVWSCMFVEVRQCLKRNNSTMMNSWNGMLCFKLSVLEDLKNHLYKKRNSY